MLHKKKLVTIRAITHLCLYNVRNIKLLHLHRSDHSEELVLEGVDQIAAAAVEGFRSTVEGR